MDIERGIYKNSVTKESWRTMLTLAFQSLGVVYGDLSTSPLYVYKSTFDEDIVNSDTNVEIYGVLSLVFWTLTLVPLLKYVIIVLRADDNGEGGTFALYSLLCRHAKVIPLPSVQLADEDLSNYKNGATSPPPSGFEKWLRACLEKHVVLQKLLLVLALLGACMVIGDGILTPALSVFSAVSGLELAMEKEHHMYVEVPAACVILILLFALQHYGTHRVGFLFAPVVLTWLLCTSAIGVYNIFRWNPHVYQALSPFYLYIYLQKTKSEGWLSLGGIILCMAGSEALYADLGHFSHSSIRLAFSSIVYPSLILGYMGQAAYLSQHHHIQTKYSVGFFASVPDKLRWPVIVIAILAAVVGSQAMITGTFSIINQCSALGCFPRVKIVHTSSKIHGQIYIPEINWTLMLICLSVTVGFRDTGSLGNAAGLAIIAGMMVTTCLMFLVIVLCWHHNVVLGIFFVAFFGTIEVLFFSASLFKFLQGAWVPVVLSFTLLAIMYIWHYGMLKMYDCSVQNRVTVDWLLGLSAGLGTVRVPGISIIHTELVSGIPSIFSHFVTNLSAFHQVVVFLCIKSVPIPHVQPGERFLVGRVGPREYSIYRCIVRYGYREPHMDDVQFESELVCSIAEFIRTGKAGFVDADNPANEDEEMVVVGTPSAQSDGIQMREIEDGESPQPQQQPGMMEVESPGRMRARKKVRFVLPATSLKIDEDAEDELRELSEAREAGVTYILGQTYVRAKPGSSLMKKIVINYGYDFMRRNCRDPAYIALNLPQASTLSVGMVYQI